MDLSTYEFFGLALTSGAVAGVANQVAKLGHDWLARKGARDQQARDLEHQETAQGREIQHQRDLQREEREHQAAIRREAAFFQARTELLPKAVDTLAWVEWAWGDLYGAEVDYYGADIRGDVRTGADAIVALNAIAGSHPSRVIRIYARALAGSIDAVIHMPDADGTADPEVNDFANWSKRANELIEALHDPEYQPKQHEKKPDRS